MWPQLSQLPPKVSIDDDITEDEWADMLLRAPEFRWQLAAAVLDDGCAGVVATSEMDDDTIAGLAKMAHARDQLCKGLRGMVTRFAADVGCSRSVAIELLKEELENLDEQQPVSRRDALILSLDAKALAAGPKERDRVRAVISKATGLERDALRVTVSKAKKKRRPR